MKRGRPGGRKILTIIIAGIIVGILVVIAIPLYIGYVERKGITEATSIMGAIITSQKVEKRRAVNYYSASTIAEFMEKGIDITHTKFFTFKTAPMPNGGFIVMATPTDAFDSEGEWVAYLYDPVRGGRWLRDETTILNDMLLIQT
jgi:Tfp pilus assembly protein PilE